MKTTDETCSFQSRTSLVVQHSAGRDGSALSALSIAKALQTTQRVCVFLGNEGPMLHEFRKAGVVSELIPHKSWMRSDRWLRLAKIIWRQREEVRRLEVAIRKVNPDVIYVNTMASLAAVFAARRLKIPVVWHLREQFRCSGGEMLFPRAAVHWWRRYTLRNVAGIIANTKESAESLLASRLATAPPAWPVPIS